MQWNAGPNRFSDLCKAVDVLPERVGGEEVHDQLVSGVGQGHEWMTLMMSNIEICHLKDKHAVKNTKKNSFTLTFFCQVNNIGSNFKTMN